MLRLRAYCTYDIRPTVEQTAVEHDDDLYVIL